MGGASRVDDCDCDVGRWRNRGRRSRWKGIWRRRNRGLMEMKSHSMKYGTVECKEPVHKAADGYGECL